MEVFLLDTTYFGNDTKVSDQSNVHHIFGFLRDYVTPIAVVAGIMTNIVIIYCFLKRNRRKLLNEEVCVAALAACDILLLCALFSVWISFYIASLSISNMWCLVTSYLLDVAKFSSLWTMVTIALNVFFHTYQNTICSDLKFRISTKCNLLILTSIFIVSIVVYLNMTLLKSIVPTNQGPVCLILGRYRATVNALSSLDTMINFIIPYGLLIILCFASLSCKVYKAVFRRHWNSQNISSNETNGERQSHVAHQRLSALTCETALLVKNQASVIRMSLLLCFTFLVCCLPCHLLQIVTRLMSEPDPKHLWHLLHWQQLLLFLYFIRPSFSFWALCVMSQYFRSLLCKSTMTSGNSNDSISVTEYDNPARYQDNSCDDAVTNV